jgi:hypothetical protein
MCSAPPPECRRGRAVRREPWGAGAQDPAGLLKSTVGAARAAASVTSK